MRREWCIIVCNYAVEGKTKKELIEKWPPSLLDLISWAFSDWNLKGLTSKFSLQTIKREHVVEANVAKNMVTLKSFFRCYIGTALIFRAEYHEKTPTFFMHNAKIKFDNNMIIDIFSMHYYTILVQIEWKQRKLLNWYYTSNLQEVNYFHKTS